MGARVPVVVELADGTVLNALVDQRDFAAAEAHDLPADSSAWQVTRTRFLAWSALKRAGETKTSWEKFNQVECVSVEAVPDSPGSAEPADRLDPGNPDQSGDA